MEKVLNDSIISAKEAREITRDSNFLRKMISKMIKNAASHNENQVDFSLERTDSNYVDQIVEELISCGYSVVRPEPEEPSIILVSW